MKCPKCGTKYDGDEEECPECRACTGPGRRSVSKDLTSKCCACGATYDSMSEYCPNCGTWLYKTDSREGDY